MSLLSFHFDTLATSVDRSPRKSSHRISFDKGDILLTGDFLGRWALAKKSGEDDAGRALSDESIFAQPH